MKKLIFTLVLLFTVSFAFATNGVEKKMTFKFAETVTIKFAENDFIIDSFKSVNSLSATCFEFADANAAYAGRKWNLSTEEEFYVFEKYFWSCQLRRML